MTGTENNKIPTGGMVCSTEQSINGCIRDLGTSDSSFGPAKSEIGAWLYKKIPLTMRLNMIREISR